MRTSLSVHASTATDPGVGRPVNEDTLVARAADADDPVERVQKGSVWVIADGVGGGTRGLEASRLASSSVVDAYWHAAAPDPALRLRAAVERTNTLLYAQNETQPGLPGRDLAGATCLAAAIVDDRLYVVHAGRSRAYLLRAGELRCLTDDHTWVAEQLRAGTLDPAEAVGHPRRNMLTRCLGIRPEIALDERREALLPGDLLLLCSDGLHRFVDEERIAGILRECGVDAAQALVDEALRVRGRDNVSAVTVQLTRSIAERRPVVERLALLARLGHELNASLEIESTLASVIEQLLDFTGADRAAILLRGTDGDLTTQAAHNVSLHAGLTGFSRTVVERAVREGQPVSIADALDDRALDIALSIAEGAVRSVLCVPLIAGEQAIGALYVDSSSQPDLFDATDTDLLVSFAAQAAAAIANARLHQQLRAQARELEQERRRQDSLVRSLSSALIATDPHGRVTRWNPAATEMLGVAGHDAIGRSLAETLPGPVAGWLQGLVVQAEATEQTILMGHQWEGAIGPRQRVVLAGRVARIRGPEAGDGGYVFILNDRTDIVLVEEARRREIAEQERQRDLFRRYLAPSVVERVLHAPDSVRLGGMRQRVTVLFADVRGFTGFTEQNEAEAVVELLNRFLALATEEIFNQDGTLDKFMGDGVMAIFGAPMPQAEHELAAVRAALAIRDRMEALRRETGVRFGSGIGLNTGDSIVGNIGTQQFMNYTAIGDVVNVAARLDQEARAGEVLASEATVAALRDRLVVEELGPLYVKGRSVPVVTYKVLGVLPDGDATVG